MLEYERIQELNRLAASTNTKTVVIGPGAGGTPVLLSTCSKFVTLALLIQKVVSLAEIGDIVGMEYLLDRKGERRLAAYFHRIGEVLRTAPQRASFATYALG